MVKILKQYLLKLTGDIVKQIIDSTYPNFITMHAYEEYLEK